MRRNSAARVGPYAKNMVVRRDWAAQVGELKASGVQKVQESASHEGVLNRPFAFMHRAFRKRRKQIQQDDQVQRETQGWGLGDGGYDELENYPIEHQMLRGRTFKMIR